MRWTRIVVLAAIVALIAGTGCGAAQKPTAALDQTRQVRSSDGSQVAIPVRPQRLAVDWVTFDNLVALGFDLNRVKAAFGYGYFSRDPGLSPHLTAAAKAAGVGAVGEPYEPDFEALALLKPDVIVLAAAQTTDEVVAKLRAIAPVVRYATAAGATATADWETTLRATATILGETAPAAAARHIAGFNQRVAAFRADHPELTTGIEVTVGKIVGDRVSVSMGRRNLGTYVADRLGLARPAVQLTHKVDQYQSFDVSLENLDLLDADVIFLEQRQDSVTFLTSHPLWKRLGAVQRHRVVFVKNYWEVGAASSVVHVLDDLTAALSRR